MAALPSPTQVAGSQINVYETYYSQLEKQGSVTAIDAAKLLKKSGLSDSILSKIWDISDPNSKGYLTKAGFFCALKLVSLAQLGHEVTYGNILMDVPPPNMGSLTNSGSQANISSIPTAANDWSMSSVERAKYDQLFDSLQPLNGVIPGNKVKGLLIDSKLPVATLGKIWDLADMDKDGSLDRHEFVVAMHLVYKALEKYTIPNTLPPELLPPNKRKNSSVQSSSPTLINGGTPSAGSISWVVTAEEKTKYDILFQRADLDKDGFVSGHEIKDIFLQSGVPQSTLADIWGLCDMKQTGKLNADQFALAMWLISQKLKGIEPPPTLAPDMVPPSMRPVLNQEPVYTPYSNPELNMISKDIEELSKEKQILEGEILQKEAEIKIRISEANSLQGELETLVATLKQLENQKGEAHKRLNDLKNQTYDSEKELKELQLVIEIEQEQVDKLSKDAEEQALLVRSQEDELMSRKKELETLTMEESKLESENLAQSQKLTSLCTFLQESQLNIIQIRSIILTIQEQQRQLKEAIEVVDKAIINNESTALPNRYLDLEPQFRDPSYKKLITNKTEDSIINNGNEIINGNKNTDFSQTLLDNDPFSSNSKFSSPLKSSSKIEDQNDPFASYNTTSLGKCDPFDPFGNGNDRPAQRDDDFSSDPFGCEPFEVSAPALPPKNKQPPPRPAPPRPAAPPSNPTDAFADFSKFNNKFENTSHLINEATYNTNITSVNHTTTRTVSPAKKNNINNRFEFTEDPFKDYHYEDTFQFAEDPFLDTLSTTDSFELKEHSTSSNQSSEISRTLKSPENVTKQKTIANSYR